MNVLMPNDVQALLKEIATGFHESLYEVAASALLLILVVAGLFSFYLRQQRREREQRRELEESRYEGLLRSLDLPVGGALLLDRLARYLKNPEKRTPLLTSEASFSSCLRKLLAHESVSPALAAEVRRKLGFSAPNPERIPLTSGDIAEGSTVMLERSLKAVGGSPGGGPKSRFPARVVEVGPDSIALEPGPSGVRGPGDTAASGEWRAPGGKPGGEPGGAGWPAKGERVTLYFHNLAGLYRLETQVLGLSGGLLRIAHCGAIASVQRRRFYRRKLSAPAYVRRTEGEEHFFKTLLQDLGGGGARLVNPHNLFELGDELEIALGPGLHKKWVRAAAEVVRVGSDGTISVRFAHLPESTRDIILKSLFRRYTSFVRGRADEPKAPTS